MDLPIAFNQALNVKARARYLSPHVSNQALALHRRLVAVRTNIYRTNGADWRSWRALLNCPMWS